MVKDDVLKLRKSNDHCTDAEKQHRAQTSATVVQCSQRRWVEHNFRLVSIILHMQNRLGRHRLGYEAVGHIHRIEFFLPSSDATVAEGSWRIVMKVGRKQCVDATFQMGLMLWQHPFPAEHL